MTEILFTAIFFKDDFFLFLTENICCDPSLEPSLRNGSNDGSRHKSPNQPCYLFLSGALSNYHYWDFKLQISNNNNNSNNLSFYYYANT